MPEASVPSRFLEEVPPQLIENLGSRNPAWSTPAYPSSYNSGRRFGNASGSERSHFNYEDESQETPHAVTPASLPSRRFTPRDKSAQAPPGTSESNIARFFGAKSGPLAKGVPQVRGPHGQVHVRGAENPRSWGPGSGSRPAMDLPETNGASGLKKGQRVMHSKYGEGTVLLREGDGEDAKLTVLFVRHGMKKLMEKFANLRKL